MATITRASLYRSILREFVKNSIHPRKNRSPTILHHLRSLYSSLPPTSSTNSPQLKELTQQTLNIITYLSSHRLHKELVERYNPTNVLSGEERARMSAGMVGLNMPKAFDPDVLPTMEGERSKERRRREEEEGKKEGEGSLSTMFGSS